MSLHYQYDLQTLKNKFMILGALVEESFTGAIRAIEGKDAELARKVIADDSRIDHLEIEVEEDCLKILALHQPVAADLRYIVTVLKVNSDLERIGDLSVNLAERALALINTPPEEMPFEFRAMADESFRMVKSSIDALLTCDEAKARLVLQADDRVDDYHRDTYERVKRSVLADPTSIDLCSTYLTISRQLERISDHAVTIAEDVIYMVAGKIVRHNKDLPR